MGSLNRLRGATAKPDAEPRNELKKIRHEIESEGQKYEFVEIGPTEPSNMLVLFLPGFRVDGEEDAEFVHAGMGQKYSTLALRGYGEPYSKTALVNAVDTVLQQVGAGKEVVLQGSSFGSGVAYDLISDIKSRDVLKRNNVIGAILETPVLDKQHLVRGIRERSDTTITRVAQMLAAVRDRTVARHRRLGKDRIQEALREKTAGKTFDVPLHVVFAEGDPLVDNEKTLTTLMEQGRVVTAENVLSHPSNKHEVADYDSVRRAEVVVIERFRKGEGKEVNSS